MRLDRQNQLQWSTGLLLCCQRAGSMPWFVSLQVAVLNDKIKFQRFCDKHGLTTPHVFPITSKDELRKLNDR